MIKDISAVTTPSRFQTVYPGTCYLNMWAPFILMQCSV